MFKRILGVICLLLALMSTLGLITNYSKRDARKTGNQAYDSGQKMGRMTAPLVPIVLGVLGIWLVTRRATLEVPPRAPRSAQPSPPPPLPGDPSLRGGQNTFASNPGLLRLNSISWLLHNPGTLAFFVSALLLGACLAVFAHPVAGAVTIFSVLLVLFRTLAEEKAKFFKGCVSPGVVLSAGQGLVAVLADLDTGRGLARPAVKIIRQPLKRIPGLEENQRLAAVALYYGDGREAAWKDFAPEVIQCFIDDAAEVERVMGSIPDSEWQQLDAYVSQLPSTTPGLYRFWGGLPKAHVSGTAWLTHKVTLMVIGAIALVVLGFIALGQFARMRANKRPPAPVVQRLPQHSQTPLDYQQRPQPVAPPQQPASQPVAVPQSIPSQLELGGRVATFTNLEGRVYEGVRLVRADGRRLIYQAEGGGGTIPLNKLSLELLVELGIPTNWPAVMQGRQLAGGVQSSRQPSGEFVAGDRVRLFWAGKNQTGTVLNRMGGSAQVRLNDPSIPIPLWLSTNLLQHLP